MILQWVFFFLLILAFLGWWPGINLWCCLSRPIIWLNHHVLLLLSGRTLLHFFLTCLQTPFKCIFPSTLNPCCFWQINIRILFFYLIFLRAIWIRLAYFHLGYVSTAACLMNEVARVCYHKFEEFLFLGRIKFREYKIVCIWAFWGRVININCGWFVLYLRPRLLLLKLLMAWHATLTLICIMASKTSTATRRILSFAIDSLICLLIFKTHVKILYGHSLVKLILLMLILIRHILPKVVVLCFHLHFLFFDIKWLWIFIFNFIQENILNN